MQLRGRVLQAALGTYTLKGSLGSDVRVILKVTLDLHETEGALDQYKRPSEPVGRGRRAAELTP
jgi:hypothetical protein